MFIVLLILLLIILTIGLYGLYKLVKWIIKKKVRIKYASGVVGAVLLAALIHHVFFKNMTFISSQVYPDLYLVKYPIEDKEAMHAIIEQKVLERFNNQSNTSSNNTKVVLPYRIQFYEYYTGTPFFVPFGEAGTVHFIENEEDPGGFSSEELSHYNQYRIAEFNVEPCKNDTLNLVGKLSYYSGWDVIKTDIIINQCTTEFKEATAVYEDAEPVSDKH